MHPGQTQFPYILISENTDLAGGCHDLAVNGVEIGVGVSTFRSESDFQTIYDTLSKIGTDFALIQAEDLNFKGDGRFARVFGHIK
ncbi:hypothetical protein [Pseudomonas sp. Sample_24]|uniref:hypothetical protein n=1 Tax=Pseudomonas sp. Sample_24 TaxID=2448268 RepID=UPI001032BEA1|nr:hypothetical protein [Pseudomonas sp. Sample_24]